MSNIIKKIVLIVDDDDIVRTQLSKELKRNFFSILQAKSGSNALEVFQNNSVDIALLDIKLQDYDGLDLLKSFKSMKPECEVIVITGYGTQDIAIQSLRYGAIDYIEKPVIEDELSAAIGRALERLTQREELSYKNTILIVDDEEDITKRLTRFFSKENFEVFCANSGKAALEIIENNKIDIIITDIHMGDMDGITVLQKAKNLSSSIEGIMVTGMKDQQLAIKALRAGAIDYIIKPVDLDELLLSVNRAIERIELYRNSLYRNRELKISSEIISKMNEELEKRIAERSRELDQTQAQLFQTSKLATLGEMSAGLAHEMNQPLGGISLIAKNLKKLHEREKLTDDELLNGLLDIELSVKRMSKVIQHIRTFARQDTLKFLEVNVNETINSALTLLGAQLRLHEIKVIRKLNNEVPKVSGEPYQLEQVLINLITNARDAVDEREQIEKKKNPDSYKFKKIIELSTHHKPDIEVPCVEIHVKDNGVGMSKETKERILEPFYTTKEVGKATGLGLAISYGIIESHKGKMEFKSIENEGTTVKIILPTGQ